MFPNETFLCEYNALHYFNVHAYSGCEIRGCNVNVDVTSADPDFINSVLV